MTPMESQGLCYKNFWLTTLFSCILLLSFEKHFELFLGWQARAYYYEIPHVGDGDGLREQ